MSEKLEYGQMDDSLLFFVVDSDGCVTAISDAFARMLGNRAHSLLHGGTLWHVFYNKPHVTLAELLVRGDEEEILRQYGRSVTWMSDRKDSCSCLLQVDRKIIFDHTLSVQASLLRNKDDSIAGAVEIFHPVNFYPFLENSSLTKILIGNLPVAVSLVFRGRLHMVNMAYAQLMGFNAPEEVEGMRPEDLIYEGDKEKFLEINARNYQELQKGTSFQWRYKTRGGGIRYVEGHPKVFDWGEEKALISVMTDVTERVAREEKLLKEQAKMSAELARLFRLVSSRHDVFIGRSPCMLEVMELALQSATTDCNIIISGETGTGKTMLARVIHDASTRREGPFVMVNCAAIPESLFESEFFGHKKGAFTGATTDSTGYFGAADNGTLVLDEVGELSKPMQAKLLHALESKTYMPVGSREMHRSNVRLICATNRDLQQMMRDGQLRTDFYFRINVVNIRLPAMRERKNDILPMVEEFFRKFNRLDLFRDIPPDVLHTLRRYDWPGNIRELQSVILRYISTGHIRFDFDAHAEFSMEPSSYQEYEVVMSPEQQETPQGLLLDTESMSMEEAMHSVRRHYFIQVLEKCGGNKSRAARMLGMKLRTFHRYCSEMGLVRRLNLK